MHFTPAGFPPFMPGIPEEIESAMQQAPQAGRHSIRKIKDKSKKTKDKSKKTKVKRQKIKVRR